MSQQGHSLAQTIQAATSDASTQDPARLMTLMGNADYLRQSSALINEALQRGFDVIQLPNGDIVATGTKIITHTYRWDDTSGKLAKQALPKTEPSEAHKFKLELEDEAGE